MSILRLDGGSNNNTSMDHHLCLEDERQLLLLLKQQLPPEFPHYHYRTKYWNRSRDCCRWDGVTCDHFTGHVIALDLSSSFGFSDASDSPLIGELRSSSSLFRLTHLRSLNLANNDFNGSTLPSGFSRLNALTHLNLSHAEFAGEIPMEFYHLSGLVSLDFAGVDWTDNKIRCDVKMLLGNMTKLRVLVLADQNLSSSELPMNMSSFSTHLDLANTGLQGNLPSIVFQLPHLQLLSLNGNEGLKVSLPKSLNRSILLSINRLDLGWTNISGRLPDYIGFMTNLKYLDLSLCSLWGTIPESIGNITVITVIDLSVNQFSGRLPSTIYNLRHRTTLSLSGNHLEGQLPDAFSSLQDLTCLNLGGNNFGGRFPTSLTNLSRLESLMISSSALTGPLPSTAALGLQHLTYMDFSNNSFQGMIPSWLFTLPSLEILDLSSNRFTGQIWELNSQTLTDVDLSSNRLNIELKYFYNLSSINTLLISHNMIMEHDAGDIVNVTFPNLERLEMISCDIKEFPNFLRSNMPTLYNLDLSNNNIHGPIPSWFSSNPLQSLQSLNLSYNSLAYAGDLPWQRLFYLDLRSNSLRGTFPTSICNMSWLYLLNLSDNKLSGNIPECLANVNTSLRVLELRRNEFHGKIPTTIGAMQFLANLGLNGNYLEGPLPPSLANCTLLEVIDLGNNMIQDTFPWLLHTLPKLKILILKFNSFHSSITSPPFTNNSFTNLQIFDLSCNNFTGLLPEKLFASLEAIKHHSQASPDDDALYMSTGGMFRADMENYEYSVTVSVKGAYVDFAKVLRIFTIIDLSSNNLNGIIPDSLSNLTSLRLLNLSHNSIYGSIPPSLGQMTNLEQLDLSSNLLTGGIPQTLTNLTFLGALNLSHNHLVGPIPVANQFLTFSNESYAGNSGLCGAPLTSCGNQREPPSEDDDEDEKEEGFMMGFTWKAVAMGYGCGTLLGFIFGCHDLNGKN